MGLQVLLTQLQAGDSMNNRKTLPGHITGSAIVLSPDREKILLIDHKLMKMWLQPGGHWDPEEPDPWTAAKREAVEETAVELAEQLVPYGDAHMPLQIETHPIPARPDKNEPEHYHHDFRYAFIAKSEELSHQEHEVAAAGWFTFDAPEAVNMQSALAKLRIAKLIP